MSSCDEDFVKGDSSQIEIYFKATYNGAPLVMNDRYFYDGKELIFTKLQFYMSNLILKNGDKEVDLDEIELIDFTSTNTSPANASIGFRVVSGAIPVGSYDGLSFGIGVPSDYNSEKPTEFSSTHPLGQSSEYWDAWNSYIFSKIEGKYDEDGDGQDLETSIFYHIGMNEMFRTKTEIDLNIDVIKEEVTVIHVELEVVDIFNDNSGMIDLSTNGTTHTNPNSAEEMALSNKVADNWVNAFDVLQ